MFGFLLRQSEHSTDNDNAARQPADELANEGSIPVSVANEHDRGVRRVRLFRHGELHQAHLPRVQALDGGNPAVRRRDVVLGRS